MQHFQFESEKPWDPKKNEENKENHGVSFEEAKEALETDKNPLIRYDRFHSNQHEDRWQVLAYHAEKKVLLLIISEESARGARFVSAWKASRAEAKIHRERKKWR